MTDWIDFPGGEVLLGLTPEEVERLVQLNVRHNERFLEEDPDLYRWGSDRAWYRDLGGNAEVLRPLLAALCPLRKAVLRPFRLARRPVLVQEYEEFCLATGRSFREPLHAKPDQFMFGVSWEGARAYAVWAGSRLPTSAEWERAARGPSRRLFPWGSDWSGDADFFMHSGSWTSGWAPGSRPGLASPDGLFDMVTDHGEWCADLYAADPEAWARLAGRKKDDFRPRWGVIMGSSPRRLLPNAALPFGGPEETDRASNVRIRLAEDA